MKLSPLGRSLCIIFCFSAALLACLCYGAVPSYAADFAVTSPWVGVIASFIGGNNSRVRDLAVWDASGKVMPISRPRAGEEIIAIDMKDAARFRISRSNKKLHLLYGSLSMTDEQLVTAFFDPAMLPFIAQNVMKIIAETDSKHYSFYQRRLAEFQSRIESTVDIGRYLLEKTKILDLTGAEGAWVRAAVPGAVRAPSYVWKVWLDGDTNALKAALDEAQKRGWLILLDPWTPPEIRRVASSYGNRFTLPPPEKGQDYFIFLHDVFLMINNRIKASSVK
ncbi:MAG: hypothetical protein LLF78_05185 [Synergistaceae bacterium]|nr:hypothetical protein [Synergistaceae bacterium]